MLHRSIVILQWWGRRICSVLLGLALAGCSSSDTRTELGGDDVKSVVTAEAPKAIQDQDSTITAKTSTTQFDPDKFTTEGKPTKTMETPWGPREFYDPLQDGEVREAFKRIMDKGDVIISHRNYTSQGSDAYKIYKARDLKIREELSKLCSFVYFNACGTFGTLHSGILESCDGDLLDCRLQAVKFIQENGPSKCNFSRPTIGLSTELNPINPEELSRKLHEHVQVDWPQEPALDATMKWYFYTDCHEGDVK